MENRESSLSGLRAGCANRSIVALLGLSPYHLRNLRWLLRMAADGHPYGPEGRVLNTGDWCGELLYELEQFMLDYGVEPRANAGPHHPLLGWYAGRSAAEHLERGGRTFDVADPGRTFFCVAPRHGPPATDYQI